MNSDQPSSSESHSVTRLIEQVKRDDTAAAEGIWRRYYERLLPLARARLAKCSDRAADEDDVLVSVFDRFFRAAKDGRFARLNDRDDLWQLLLMLTERTLTDHHRRSSADKRGAGRLVNEADLLAADLDQIKESARQEPSHEFVAEFNERLSEALNLLHEPTTREVALLKLEGFANREIRERLGISLSSVERKLRVVRELWGEHFGR